VRIRFAGSRPTLAEIAAVRKAFPQFTDLPPNEARARLASAELELDEMGGIEAGGAARAAREAGLTATVERWVETTVLIIDASGPNACLIEDDGEHERVVREMIAAGVKIADVIVD
jgi:hypothetical protein